MMRGDEMRERVEKAIADERVALGIQAGNNPPRGVTLFDQKIAQAVMREIEQASA
jgi:hypothetical protein